VAIRGVHHTVNQRTVLCGSGVGADRFRETANKVVGGKVAAMAWLRTKIALTGSVPQNEYGSHLTDLYKVFAAQRHLLLRRNKRAINAATKTIQINQIFDRGE
jgi:hypothetical protein